MKLLNYIGIILMAIGLFTGAYYAMEWYKGKSSAQQLTKEEIKSLNNIQHNKLSHETAVTSQVPSAQTEHKEGEKVALLNIPKIKKKFSIYWGADDATLKKGVGMFVSDLTTTPSGGDILY